MLDYSIVGALRRRQCPITPHRHRLIKEALAIVGNLGHRLPAVTVQLFHPDVWGDREPRAMTFWRLNPIAIFVQDGLGDQEFLGVLLHECWHAMYRDDDLTKAEREARADEFALRAVAEWERRYASEARCRR